MSKNTKNSNSNKEELQKDFSPLLFELSPIAKKSVELSFSGEKISTDGGLLLLREVENQKSIIEAMVNCINDERHQSYVEHPIKSLLTQRIFQIAAGYEDANDCNTLRDDLILKLCVEQNLSSEKFLSSQPTMSRFENSIPNKELYKIAVAFVDNFVQSYKKEPPAIIIDCDDTDSTAHGNQQLALFNTYYGEKCFMPLHIYEGFSGKLITTILKPGKRSSSKEIFSILSRIINHLRKTWKNTLIIVRGDSHFCSKELMDWAEAQERVHFLTGLTANAVLNKLAETTIESAKKLFASSKKPVKIYHSFEYKAESWGKIQRVIVKVEVSEKGTNIRYITTDIRCVRTKALYENGYCARGKMELYIKESKTYLESDRMSCNSFKANQFRLFMHSAAYILLHTFRTEFLSATQYANATFKTIRLRLLKIAAYVKEMKTRIKIEFPKQFPDMHIVARCINLLDVRRC